MKTCNTKLILTALTTALLMVLLLISCKAESNTKSHWFVDSNGHFHTDNVTLAQKQIPFTIVVPSYIPDVLGADYQYEITGPFKNIHPGSIEADIQYGNDTHQIFIKEYNYKDIMLPTQELDPVYYEIAGIRVLRQITGFMTGSGSIKGLGYYWNTDNLTFEVEMINIPEDEGIKMVESMIVQMKQ